MDRNSDQIRTSILRVVLDCSGSMSVFGKGPLQVNLACFVRQYICQHAPICSSDFRVKFYFWRDQVLLLEDDIDSEHFSINYEGKADRKSLTDFLKELPSQSKILLFSDGFSVDDNLMETISTNTLNFNMITVGPDCPSLARYSSERITIAESEHLYALLQNLLYNSEGNTRPQKIGKDWLMEVPGLPQEQIEDDGWE